MAHAGWSVVFSGTTVAIALLALLIFPVPFLRSIAIAGAFIPLVSVAVAITLLPVVLATIGPRLDWPRVRRADRAGRFWTAWARIVVRHRWVAAVASTAVLLLLAAAAFSIQLGEPARRVARPVGRRARRPGEARGRRHRRRPAVAVRGARARRRSRGGRRDASPRSTACRPRWPRPTGAATAPRS